GFEKKNRRLVHVLTEQREIVTAEEDGLVEIPLTERGPPATFPPPHECDFKAGGLQYFHRRDADARFVIAHKRVVPQHRAPAKCRVRTRVFRKPLVKPLLREMRQRAPRSDAEKPRTDEPRDG